MKRLAMTSILVLAILLSGCAPVLSFSLGGAAGLLTAQSQTASTEKAAAPVTVQKSEPAVMISGNLNGEVAALQGTLSQIYDQVNPSVVNIQVWVPATDAFNSPFTRRGASQPLQEGLGSGFVWDTDGHIVTNNHVVDGATKINVTFADGLTVPATLVGADPASDLAVIKVDVAAESLHPVILADSSQVKVGQLAIAIGNPYGLSGTMTQGIVSALSRSLPVESGSSSGATYSIPDIIQTDAAINPGNSGGVLLNDQGHVMGVTAAIQSVAGDNSGIGFVIPSNIVARVVPVLITEGKYDHARMGISGATLTPDLAKAMNLSEDQKGVLVITVVEGSPAEKAGLKASTQKVEINGKTGLVGGDVIVAIDGTEITRFEDITSYLFNNTQAGQTVTLTVLRDG
ncbi:MAG TPA: trypsin-like peptidase domain-containing protein [Anaerolineaceae bacterium]|nr:trypsin-like peptidase domain-containing protein [Anaerolineaceae bacterium]HPN51358.1 trypsin-like peptidase domain-containing protein [Anaerolineaceae bacterium]